ncbi:UNVERIFIED_CONTAM: hypothetical protein GTU68_034366 [Idotea baltica]|nr:hypothetical protein [Idotea baltica]
MPNIIEILKNRNLLHDATDEAAINLLKTGTKFYFGVDPTAPSLQIGNLVALRSCIRLAEHGFKPIILIGGATGSIGDPSGKSKERILLDQEQVTKNVAKQKTQIISLFAKFNIEIDFVNNLDWTKDIKLLSFFRDIGKHFSLSYMLQKETVKSRVDTSGISFTEFSYMLLQAFDFLTLYEQKDCKLQVGGSDQWGNITAGLELIRRKAGGQAYALSFPLLLDKNGKKFGKTENGTIWLDPEMTSPYELHQFLINTDDSEVINYLKIFTNLNELELKELETATNEKPELRSAQNILADSVCELIHGTEALKTAKASATVLFGGSIEEDVPSWSTQKSEIKEMNPIDLFSNSGAVNSKADAKRLLKEGGLYINNLRVTDGQEQLANTEFLNRDIVLLRTGKKKYRLITID